MTKTFYGPIIKTMLEKDFEIKYYELNSNKALKESSFFLFLQDAATQSAEKLGFGPSFVFSNGYAWFLLKYKIQMDVWPRDLETIKIKTNARGFSKLYAYRDFEIFAPDGTHLGKVMSLWAIADISTRKMLVPFKTIKNAFKYEKLPDDLECEKIPPIEKIDLEKTFEVGYDDIDVNKHVNNANYIKWALELFGHEFRDLHYVKKLDIFYKKEIGLDGKILSLAEFNKENLSSIHILKNQITDEDLCQIKIEWEKY